MSLPQRLANRGLYYGWVVVAVCFANLFCVMGIRFAFGVFYVAILADTGWQRAETAAIFSVSMAVYALTILLSGALFDWLGPRRLFPAAIAVLGVGLALTSRISNTFEFYLAYGVIVGFSYALLGFPTHMAVVPRWFVRRRGLAAALVLSGSGMGALAFALLSEHLIQGIGWRETYLSYAALVVVLLVPLNLLLQRETPESVQQAPDGLPVPPPGTQAVRIPEGYTLGQALRTPVWWLLFTSVTLVGFNMMTFVVHQTRLSLDFGYTLPVATALFGLTGFTRTVGGLIWGSLSDRIGRRPCFIIGGSMGAIGVGLLLAARWSPAFGLLLGFAVVFGIGYMGITPVYASTVADHFAGRHLGKIIAMLDIGFGIGSSTGPWLAGYLFDRFGTYDIVLVLMLAGTALTGLCLSLAAGMKPRVL